MMGCLRGPVAFRALYAFAVCVLPQQARQRDGGVGTPQALNRILVEDSEVDWSVGRATLAASDRRAVHVRDVLHKTAVRDTLRAGVADDFLVDDAPVSVLDDLSVRIDLPEELRRPPPPPPEITLLLALPRPKVLARMLPHIAAIGVKRVVLVNAYKVERAYFDSAIVKDPSLSREALLDGIMQAGVDVHIPEFTSEKRLKVFLEDTLPHMVSPNAIRIVAEPDESGTRISDVLERYIDASSLCREVVLAIGPEGGWMPREVYMLEELHSFHRITLGSRILKTDAAVILALGLIHEALSRAHRAREEQLPAGV